MDKKQVDWKWLFILILVGTSLFFVYKFQGKIIYYSIITLKYKELNIFLTGGTFIVTILHKIKIEKPSWDWDTTFNQFYEQFKKISGMVTKPAAVASSFALIRGLYLQAFDNTCKSCYFKNFADAEIVFLWGVALYLIFSTVTDVVKRLIELLITEKTETAQGRK
ncbi:hypothetical protein [Pontibacter vulgaris]|uniref:hypothetical protein n=1 Tax=Pontibacter vulgaris TaxID=2905679 RepID=UPI001FA7CA54|nr:hypothetical protein [Pontibacter vulgaris]